MTIHQNEHLGAVRDSRVPLPERDVRAAELRVLA
jgi:hypothetical protein